MKMSVTRALAELKNLDSKISNYTNLKFIDCKKSIQEVVCGVPIEDIEKGFQSNYDKIASTINNRDVIKRAVIASNAVTQVTIGYKTMSVAEAIDLKNTINNKVQLLNAMRKQYSQAIKNVEQYNASIEDDAEMSAQNVFGQKQKSDTTEFKKYVQDYIDRNKYELIDPIKLKDKIDSLEGEIHTFKTEVDFVLSESNARTEIEVYLS
mgnify:CR=1 FL=1